MRWLIGRSRASTPTDVPDAKTILKIARALRPDVIEQLHRQVVEVAKRARVTHGRRFRVDTTVVERTMHYPHRPGLVSPRRWRVGWEGRISVIKRRHGLRRCRYRGVDGTARWIGLGVIANNHREVLERAGHRVENLVN